MIEKINSDYGIVMRNQDLLLGYYGWPSVARLSNGRIMVAASGTRLSHVCPFGQSIVAESEDEGKTWSLPMLANSTALDDRDTGIVDLGKGKLALTWFTNSRAFQYQCAKDRPEPIKSFINAYLNMLTDEQEDNNIGSFIRYSNDNGKTWGEKIKVPVSAPHGFIVLKDGSYLYFGKELDGYYPNIDPKADSVNKNISAYKSSDGINWNLLGKVSIPEGMSMSNFHEPHAIELKDGTILGLIRVQDHKDYPFTIFKTISNDSGLSWSNPIPTGMTGSPPHLLRHSSGAIICAYAERSGASSCEKVFISYDEGNNWKDYIIDDRATHGDMGYPASVELADKSILTVYYQYLGNDKKASILSSIWELPKCDLPKW